MRIFVTGGTGFLGKHVVKELHRRGHRLLLLSRRPHKGPGVKFVKGDLSDVKAWEKQVKAFKPETAIHLAWEGLPSQDFGVTLRNVIGGLNCIRALGESGCRTMVVVGSDQEYGHTGKRVSERSPTKPYNLLFSAKVALYWLGSKVAEQHNMAFIWPRIFFVYGPGQRSGALIPYLVSTLRVGGEPEIRNPYGANDFVYIDDVVRALVLLATKKPKSKNEIYNVGYGKLTPTAKVINGVYALFKRPKPKFAQNDPKRPATWLGCYADIGKIKADYGWRPMVNLEEGIAKTVKQLMRS